MTDVSKLTTDQIRDELAKMDGWTFDIDHWWKYTISKEHGGRTHSTDPHPLTLHGAAKALPKGWIWLKRPAPDNVTETLWFVAGSLKFKEAVIVAETGDEIHDRYLLALMARQVEKETNGNT